MKTLEPNLAISSSLTCAHCAGQIRHVVFDATNTPFCCQGCRTVYGVLHTKGLEDYYRIKAEAASLRTATAVITSAAKFTYLDGEEFLAEYSYRTREAHRAMEFYLEGVHCLACLWLIEKLPFLLPSVLSARLDMERSVVTVILSESGEFAAAARELVELGYRPHPLKKNQDAYELKLKEERLSLLRIGIAAAGASNIMLYAVSNYAGASGTFAQAFNILSVLFALPVLTFSAWPFYRNSWLAIKQRSLSIDVPISMSLVLGLGLGLYNLAQGVPDNYFDSLTALVFLLLLSRYFLRKIQERAIGAQDLHFFYQSESVWRAKDASWREFEEVHPRFVRVGDTLRISPGEFFPVDGAVLQGRSHVNASLLTGEVTPLIVRASDEVYAGTQNLTGELMVKVEKISRETRLGAILRGVESGWSKRPAVVDLTERISKYFILAVLALSGVLFVKVALAGQWPHALEQSLTLLIVTCPCALALSVPLTFTRSLSRASQAGIVIKNDAVVQKLSEVKEVFFDKTGTLTFGRMQVKAAVCLAKPIHPLADLVLTLEAQSTHPHGVALCNWARAQGAIHLASDQVLETPGLGVEARIQGVHYEINREGLLENGQLMARFIMEEELRTESARVIADLHAKGLVTALCSGDGRGNVEAIAQAVGISLKNAHFAVSPEEKTILVRNAQQAMMVGDGANDALALSSAYVGVAVLGAMDISLRAADVYLAKPGLDAVSELLVLGGETMRVIRRNLALSLAYNCVSVIAVFMGWIGPLTAAVIMPASSLTVLLSTIWGTKALRDLWKS